MGIDSEVFLDIHESLKCPVCLDVMDDPATALCGHSCCYFCWFSIAMKSELSPKEMACPICRKHYSAPAMRSFSTFIILMSGGPLINNLIAKQIIDDSLTKCHWPGCHENIKYSERDRHFEECVHAIIPRIRYLPSISSEDSTPRERNIDIHGCPLCEEGFECIVRFRQHLHEDHDLDGDIHITSSL